MTFSKVSHPIAIQDAWLLDASSHIQTHNQAVIEQEILHVNIEPRARIKAKISKVGKKKIY